MRLSSSCLLSGHRRAGWLTLCVAGLVVPGAAAQPLVLVNHVGYDVAGPKRAIVQGHQGDAVRSCEVQDAASGLHSLRRSREVGCCWVRRSRPSSRARWRHRTASGSSSTARSVATRRHCS